MVRMMMEKDGWWLRMSLPSSTIEIRCPIPGDGYMTIASNRFLVKTACGPCLCLAAANCEVNILTLLVNGTKNGACFSIS